MKVRKNMVDLDGTSSALVEQISLYTMQLEEYDRLSANYNAYLCRVCACHFACGCIFADKRYI